MAVLMGQSCCALVAKALLVNLLVVEMLEYCWCCGKFVWSNGDPLEDWEVSWGFEL
jgi:hypothetical protein